MARVASSSGSNVGSPWAATVDEVAFHRLETALGAFCPVSMTRVGLWMMRMYDSESVGEYVTRHPKVWCDCRLARDDVSGVCVPLVLWLLPGYPMTRGSLGSGVTKMLLSLCLEAMVGVARSLARSLGLCRRYTELSFGVLSSD